MKRSTLAVLCLSLAAVPFLNARDKEKPNGVKAFEEYFNCYSESGLATRAEAPSYLVLAGQKWNQKHGFYVVRKTGSYFVPLELKSGERKSYDLSFPETEEIARIDIALQGRRWIVKNVRSGKHSGDREKIKFTAKTLDSEFFLELARNLEARIDLADKNHEQIRAACGNVNSPIVKRALYRLDERLLPVAKRPSDKAPGSIYPATAERIRGNRRTATQ